jgi:NAD(P)-dependent dehydrogenase (short-subunit alcohol dehydrogenase family)
VTVQSAFTAGRRGPPEAGGYALEQGDKGLPLGVIKAVQRLLADGVDQCRDSLGGLAALRGAYTTPKVALHGLTRTMSRELAPAGILTNLVMAAFVPKRELPPQVLEPVTKAAAIGRVSEAREVASPIVFLCSAANTNITGELIRADGHFLTRT